MRPGGARKEEEEETNESGGGGAATSDIVVAGVDKECVYVVPSGQEVCVEGGVFFFARAFVESQSLSLGLQSKRKFQESETGS